MIAYFISQKPNGSQFKLFNYVSTLRSKDKIKLIRKDANIFPKQSGPHSFHWIYVKFVLESVLN